MTARESAFRELCRRFYFDVAKVEERERAGQHHPASADEDLALFLTGQAPICRYVAVTRHEDLHYVYPLFDRREDACDRAVEDVNDSIFAEYPVAVVDLDTGEEWSPGAPTFAWPSRVGV